MEVALLTGRPGHMQLLKLDLNMSHLALAKHVSLPWPGLQFATVSNLSAGNAVTASKPHPNAHRCTDPQPGPCDITFHM